MEECVRTDGLDPFLYSPISWEQEHLFIWSRCLLCTDVVAYTDNVISLNNRSSSSACFKISTFLLWYSAISLSKTHSFLAFIWPVRAFHPFQASFTVFWSNRCPTLSLYSILTLAMASSNSFCFSAWLGLLFVKQLFSFLKHLWSGFVITTFYLFLPHDAINIKFDVYTLTASLASYMKRSQSVISKLAGNVFGWVLCCYYFFWLFLF